MSSPGPLRARQTPRTAGTGLVLGLAAVVVLATVTSHASAGSPSVTAGSTSTGANVTLGRHMAAARGWTGGQWSCLDWLWTRESGWSAYAANPTSDARGIPQSINGWSSYAPGDAASQIRWGDAYISGRYGTPCNAWAHETSAGWY